ncbi:MAG: Maf family protein [Gammaproteobacteria bacterium]|nr:septum formation inhibitor Maf [Pseudomonadales bacterium]MCP5345264.1 septum formation inhibitor Maf [Pseudomonadales bacterium]
MTRQKRPQVRQDEILLASASPRRRELLRQIGVPFRVVEHTIDEIVWDQELPQTLAQRLALEKACSVLEQHSDGADALVLGADTVVVCGNLILGKPENREDALRMLKLLSGRRHLVHSAVALASQERQQVVLSTTEVEFRPLESDELEAYWRSGEPRDKAGAYAVQGLAAVFVSSLRGSYSGVMGLPLFETAQLLNSFGFTCWQTPPTQSAGAQ